MAGHSFKALRADRGSEYMSDDFTIFKGTRCSS